MEIKQIIENANLSIPKDNILYNEDMKKHTTFKIGGPAECFIKIKTKEQLKEILVFAKENKIQITILGNGSNVLVLDGGIKGITLTIQIEYLDIKQNNEKYQVYIGGGYKLAKLAQYLLKNGISGFEELSGIPGTIGGAVSMNAGAHGKEMKDIVQKIKCVDINGNEKEFLNEEAEFGYRKSIFKGNSYIVTEVELNLQKGNKDEIKEKMDEYAKYRKEKQPIEYPSAGSTFKRGKDYITAKLIDEAGLKGYSIGGAVVSTKHSGFVINKGNATAKDVLELVKYIKDTIEDKFGKKIELEIEVVGEEKETATI